jgi:hypothetical protein
MPDQPLALECRMVRFSLVAAALTPAILILLWGDTLALLVGSASDGFQANYYPPPVAEAASHDVEVLETRRVVPSDGLPTGVDVNTSNNNLDATRHTDGRVYLAWRTAPDHFAGSDTVIQVVSSTDERNWRFERRVTMRTDLREPRLLSLNGSLFLYMSKLGSNRWAFTPQGVLVTEKRANGTWSDVESVNLPGYIAWRTRVEQGQPMMSAYLGGEAMYRFNGAPIHVDLLTTKNGRNWFPVDAKHKSVYVGGGSEADFTIDKTGALFGVIRNESGDDSGFGSKICSALPGRTAEWSCRSDVRKFDSPQMFKVGDEVYLLARRNVTRDGRYDLANGPFSVFRSIRNQLNYVTTAKRCALWHFDRAKRDLSFVKDLPSKGDTCFPAVVPTGNPGELAVYNYSSPIDGADVPWSVGQRKPTYIYRHVLKFASEATN